MLTYSTEVIETEAIAYAERYAADSEQGKGTAVINSALRRVCSDHLLEAWKAYLHIR